MKINFNKSGEIVNLINCPTVWRSIEKEPWIFANDANNNIIQATHNDKTFKCNLLGYVNWPIKDLHSLHNLSDKFDVDKTKVYEITTSWVPYYLLVRPNNNVQLLVLGSGVPILQWLSN